MAFLPYKHIVYIHTMGLTMKVEPMIGIIVGGSVMLAIVVFLCYWAPRCQRVH